MKWLEKRIRKQTLILTKFGAYLETLGIDPKEFYNRELKNQTETVQGFVKWASDDILSFWIEGQRNCMEMKNEETDYLAIAKSKYHTTVKRAWYAGIDNVFIELELITNGVYPMLLKKQ